ncbi:phosphotransferase family protein [Shimia biformata]|uniref:phosphotransferase family protein n=1 Tax=Shimia biformata TaxID=1294299 RepID=UPI0019518E92|nr:aminoglycoside phosphotransferase family protein [Shimia biformata]
MSVALDERCKRLVAALGVARPDDVTEVTPLTGGVASDIAKVDVAGRRICVKFALPKLKVAEDWNAPVHRNRAEYEWLRVASEIAPDSAVRLYGRSEEQHGFAMEFLDGDAIYLWKSVLLDKVPPKGEAAAVGDLIGRIHAASARPGFDSAPFQNRDDFRALRIEPYLTFTATRHEGLRAALTGLADMLYADDKVLVHGDVSPKNILFRGGRPVVLDAECATMGDASFDPAFCLNHLVLKAIHLPVMRDAYLEEVLAFWAAYERHVDWESVARLEARIAALLPALMLARIDGKSPVEYLTPPGKARLRMIAPPLINSPKNTLAGFVETVAGQLKELDR